MPLNLSQAPLFTTSSKLISNSTQPFCGYKAATSPFSSFSISIYSNDPDVGNLYYVKVGKGTIVGRGDITLIFSVTNYESCRFL